MNCCFLLLQMGPRPPSAAVSADTMFLLERILLVVFTVSSPICLLASVAGTTIQGKVGQKITLPCHYSTEENGIRTICWGRGSCPLSWCSSEIFLTNEQQSIYKKDSKYYLLGDVDQGDVSLTIVNVTEEDSGTYCCRVDISGLFNDLKHNIEVVIEKGNWTPTSARVSATIHFTETYFALEPRWRSNTQSPQDNISVYFTTLREQRKEEPSRTVLYVATGTCAVLLLIVTMLALKWYLHKKEKMSNSISQVAISSSVTGGIQHIMETGVRAPENIYEMD